MGTIDTAITAIVERDTRGATDYIDGDGFLVCGKCRTRKQMEVTCPMQTMTHAEWLEARRGGIGGSDAAAILGLNPYMTPFAVWADKVGKLPARDDSEAMRQGRDFGGYVAQRFTEATGKKVRRKNGILRNPAYPFALANIDRQIVGEDAGLECKTTSVLNLKKFRGGEFPPSYYVQCVHYLAVTGAARWYLAVLILNQDFLVFTVERDKAEIAELMRVEGQFWDTYIAPQIPPPVDGLPPTSEAISRIYTGMDNGDAVDLSELASTFELRKAIKEQIGALETQKEQADQAIKLALGEHTAGYCGPYKATWKPQARATLDKAAFAQAHPDIDLAIFEKVTETRPLNVKEKKVS